MVNLNNWILLSIFAPVRVDARAGEQKEFLIKWRVQQQYLDMVDMSARQSGMCARRRRNEHTFRAN